MQDIDGQSYAMATVKVKVLQLSENRTSTSLP